MTSTILPPSTTATPPPGPGGGFGPLARQIREAGLLEPHRDFFLATAILDLGLLWLTGTLLVALQGSWWALAIAPLAAIAAAQLSFLGHDIGHHQVFTDRRYEWVAGVLVGNLLTGLSFGWWNDKHHRHHANPNVDGVDPDVADNVIAWSDRQAARRTGFGLWFAKHQASFFLPLLTFTGWSLRVQGVRALSERKGWKGVVEAGLLAIHVAAVIGFLWWIAGPVFAVVFILVMNLCYGLIMGMSFAPNHKGMATPEPGQRWDHLRKQVLTSRNIAGSVFVDWWYGGLNHQIEHHLFPSMPRPNLKRAQPIVRQYCADLGLPYHEVSVVQSYREIWAHLDQVA